MRVRQPFAVLGFSFASVLFICSWLTSSQMKFLFPLWFLILAAGIFFALKKRGSALLLFSVMALLATGISIAKQEKLWDVYESFPEKNITVTGRSSSGSASEGILVRGASVSQNGKTVCADLIIYGNNDLTVYSGETFSVSASLQGIASAAQQGKGAQLSAWADSSSLRILKDQPLHSRLRDSARSFLISNIYLAIPDAESAAMTAAVLTGDDSAIPGRTYSLYQRSGIAHVLCVSGLHLSILSALILAALTFAGRRPALLFSMILMGIFVWFTGSGPSAVRAWIMVCLVMSAELFYRDSAPVNSLGFAVLLLTAAEPALVCRMGFLLSVTSVLAVTAIAPSWQSSAVRLFGWEEKSLPSRLLNILLPSAAVSLATLPVMMLFTGYVPVTAPLVNTAVLPLMPFLLICALLTGLTGWSLMGTLCQKILAVFEFAAELGAKGPVLPLRSEYALIGVGCCLLLAATVFLLRGRDHARTAAGLLSVTVLCGGYFFDALSRQNSLTVTQYTFSKGSSIVLQQGSRAVLVGAGGKSFDGRQLVSELLANGVQTVDALIIPADKSAYTGGSYDMLTALGAAVVIAPENSRLTQGLDFGKAEQNYPLSDSLWELFGSGTLNIHTGGDSAAITVTWSNSRILLDSSDDQVPWPADVRLNYDKSAEESDTTRENYVIMISSGSRLRPAARLELPTSNETKGAV